MGTFNLPNNKKGKSGGIAHYITEDGGRVVLTGIKGRVIDNLYYDIWFDSDKDGNLTEVTVSQKCSGVERSHSWIDNKDTIWKDGVKYQLDPDTQKWIITASSTDYPRASRSKGATDDELDPSTVTGIILHPDFVSSMQLNYNITKDYIDALSKVPKAGDLFRELE